MLRRVWSQQVRVFEDGEACEFRVRPGAAPRPTPPIPVEADLHLRLASAAGTLLFFTRVLDVYEEDLAGWLTDHLVDISDLHVNPRDYEVRWWIVERRDVELDVLFALHPGAPTENSLESVPIPLELAAVQMARTRRHTGQLDVDIPGTGVLRLNVEQGRLRHLAMHPLGAGLLATGEPQVEPDGLAAGAAAFALPTPLDALLPARTAAQLGAFRLSWLRQSSLSVSRLAGVLALFFAILALGFSWNTRHLKSQSLSLHQLRDSLQTLLEEQATYARQVEDLVGPVQGRTQWAERLQELAACSSDSVIWTDLLVVSGDGRCLLHGLALDPAATLHLTSCVTGRGILQDPVLSPVRLARRSELPLGVPPETPLHTFELSGRIHD